MKISHPNPKTNWFFEKDTQWKQEYEVLREMLLGSGLVEELKWGCPCYALDGGNVVLVHGFKEYCALLFFKGAIMNDPSNALIQQTVNVQSARQIRFTSVEQITEMKQVIKNYIHEAIRVEKAGLKVEFKKPAEFPVTDELQAKFDQDSIFKQAFYNLTPGRQRAYLLHFGSAKQSQTRVDRIEKCIPMIMDGVGLTDAYNSSKKVNH
jgi:uncharacterized protein YdeI (YjbR/CyaY-like superfamily)